MQRASYLVNYFRKIILYFWRIFIGENGDEVVTRYYFWDGVKTLFNPSYNSIIITSQNILYYLPHLRSVLHWLPKFCPRLEKRIGIDLPKWVNYQWPTSKFWQWSFAIHWVAQKWLSCIFLIYRKSNREDLRLHPWKKFKKLVIGCEIYLDNKIVSKY